MIIIGNHEYELQFTMPVWEKFEEKIGLVENFDEIFMQRGRLRKVPEIVAIMSIEQPVSVEKIWHDMVPSDVRNIVGEAREVIRQGLKMDTKAGEDEIVDEVLEEIEKKETQAD